MSNITVITTRNLKLNKKLCLNGDIEAFTDQKPKTITVEENEVNNIHEFSKLLCGLENKPCSAIIRGSHNNQPPPLRKNKEGVTENPPIKGCTFRRKEVFDDLPCPFLLFDIDGYKGGDIEHFIKKELPEQFQNVSYHYQYSNGHNYGKNIGKLRVHLWFWLETPINSITMMKWAKQYNVDGAAMRKIQLLFTANPEFEKGVTDPVETRSELIIKENNTVNLILEPVVIEKRQTTPCAKGAFINANTSDATYQKIPLRLMPEYLDRLFQKNAFANHHYNDYINDVFFPLQHGYEDGEGEQVAIEFLNRIYPTYDFNEKTENLQNTGSDTSDTCGGYSTMGTLIKLFNDNGISLKQDSLIASLEKLAKKKKADKEDDSEIINDIYKVKNVSTNTSDYNLQKLQYMTDADKLDKYYLDWCMEERKKAGDNEVEIKKLERTIKNVINIELKETKAAQLVLEKTAAIKAKYPELTLIESTGRYVFYSEAEKNYVELSNERMMLANTALRNQKFKTSFDNTIPSFHGQTWTFNDTSTKFNRLTTRNWTKPVNSSYGIPETYSILFQALGDDKAEKIDHILKMIAYKYTRPEDNTIPALCISGDGGVGKTLFAEQFLAELFCKTQILTAGEDELFGEFNASMKGKTVIVLEEAMRNEKFKRKLKKILGSDTLSIQDKGLDRYTVDNTAWYIITSNELVGGVVLEGNGVDRRYSILTCEANNTLANRLKDAGFTIDDLLNDIRNQEMMSGFLSSIIAKYKDVDRIVAFHDEDYFNLQSLQTDVYDEMIEDYLTEDCPGLEVKVFHDLYLERMKHSNFKDKRNVFIKKMFKILAKTKLPFELAERVNLSDGNKRLKKTVIRNTQIKSTNLCDYLGVVNN